MLSSWFPLSLCSALVFEANTLITYLFFATPCLKPDQTGFVYDCWSFNFRTFQCVRLAKVLGEFDSVRLPKVRRTSYSGLSVQTPGKFCLRNMERVGVWKTFGFTQWVTFSLVSPSGSLLKTRYCCCEVPQRAFLYLWLTRLSRDRNIIARWEFWKSYVLHRNTYPNQICIWTAERLDQVPRKPGFRVKVAENLERLIAPFSCTSAESTVLRLQVNWKAFFVVILNGICL